MGKPGVDEDEIGGAGARAGGEQSKHQRSEEGQATSSCDGAHARYGHQWLEPALSPQSQDLYVHKHDTTSRFTTTQRRRYNSLSLLHAGWASA